MKSIICENYKVFIGENILRNVQLDSYKKICLLTDKNQKNNILDYFLKEIKSEFDIIEIESSEINKNFSSVLNIWNFLSQNNYNKNSLIINLGGGVICDIGGFCASTFKRGVDFLNIPTTCHIPLKPNQETSEKWASKTSSGGPSRKLPGPEHRDVSRKT